MTPRGVIKAVTTGAQAVIPPRKNHTVPCEYDKHLYRERHLVKCFRHQDQALPASVLTLRQVGKELLELCEFCQRAHLATMKCQHNLVVRHGDFEVQSSSFSLPWFATTSLMVELSTHHL